MKMKLHGSARAARGTSIRALDRSFIMIVKGREEERRKLFSILQSPLCTVAAQLHSESGHGAGHHILSSISSHGVFFHLLLY